MEWYISNIEKLKSQGIVNNYSSNLKGDSISDKVHVFIDGYVLPRVHIFNTFQSTSQQELVSILYEKYKLDFVNYIKGAFCIIIFDGESVYVINDRHAFKKFFIYQNDGSFIISNSIQFIIKNATVSVSKINAIVFCLHEHYVDGRTLFNEISFSKGASLATISQSISIKLYWKINCMLEKQKEYFSLDSFSHVWKTIITHYIDYLKPKQIGITLTGGNDSRMILSALKSTSVDFSAFTFGNPLSLDGIIASRLAQEINIRHHNHYVQTPTNEWFKEFSHKIIEKGNSLINIHRSHRLDAIEKEVLLNPKLDMLFCGFLGGEYIKGIIYDDYITSKLFRLYKNQKNNKIDILKSIINENHIVASKNELSDINEIVSELSFYDDRLKDIERELLYIYEVIGCTHITQDISLFGSKVKYIMNPFVDIDFLDILFSSYYSMLDKNNSEDTILKKMKYPKLHIEISHNLSPELSHIPYAKKAYYSNNEFIGNKGLYMLKRIIRHIKQQNYPASFPYAEWMNVYVSEMFSHLHPDVEQFFNLTELKKILQMKKVQNQEKYWHKYTNIINLSNNLSYFSNKS